MPSIIKELILEEKRRGNTNRKDLFIPFRPDHGNRILSDFGMDHYPGYPLIGRLKGLSELSGVIAGINQS